MSNDPISKPNEETVFSEEKKYSRLNRIPPIAQTIVEILRPLIKAHFHQFDGRILTTWRNYRSYCENAYSVTIFRLTTRFIVLYSDSFCSMLDFNFIGKLIMSHLLKPAPVILCMFPNDLDLGCSALGWQPNHSRPSYRASHATTIHTRSVSVAACQSGGVE